MKLSRFYKLVFSTMVLIGGWIITLVSFADNPSITPLPLLPQTTNHVEIAREPMQQDINGTNGTRKLGGRIWNLQDADILSVINEVSQETGKNFVVDPRVNGKITLISSKPLREGEVYQVFLTVLGMLGYSAVPSGDVIKIVPNMESGEQATPVATARTPGKGEEVVVRVIRLENVSSTQLIPILRPLLPQWSNISAYAPGNVIVLLGRADNLERLVKIIHEVDKAANSSIQMIPLRHASAVQVATVLNNLQNAARATGESPGMSVAVDERSNSVLIGGSKALRLRMRVLIAQLDAPESMMGNTEVVYLRYLEAKKFAPLLSKIAQNILGKDKEGGGGYNGGTVTSSPTYNTNYSTSNVMNTNSGSTSTSSLTAKDTETTVNQGIIQAEPNSNALIITAPPALMKALRMVIAKLDIRPAQVLVEAIIAQVDESNLRSLGIQWGSVGRGGRFILGGEGPLPTDFPPLGAGVVGILPNGTDIKAVLSVLENLNGVDILSTPSIVVLDNQKAVIEIGQQVPYLTGTYTTPTGTNTGATVQPFQTTEAKDVTLKLEVTPQINLSNLVRLGINLKNDSLQNPQNPGLTPIINTSKIENMVIVRSEDILVLGGLMSDANNENINKVPILGDIPGIGLLFQQKTRKVTKRVLMVFIKPIIMWNSEDSNCITQYKYEEMRSIQANYREDLLHLREDQKILLPPWKNQRDLPTPFETDLKCPNGACA